MSIIKDNANGGKRIVRFANGLIPKTDASGNLISGGSGRYAQTYADMGTGTTGWFQIDGSASVNDSFLISASIPQDSNGYFFGCYKSTGIGVWLRKSADKVYFKCGNGGSAEASVDWQEGFHIYGFITSENGTRLLYDGQYVNQSSYTSPLSSSDHYYAGRCYGRVSSSADSPANVLIGKVVAVTDKTYHYYPTSTSVAGVTTSSWYETREYQNVRKSIGLTSGVSAPYGVSIEDLREITGSPYHDLVAILMADNGNPAEGADIADYLVQGGVTHNFAFTLAPTEYDPYTREQLSIPHPAGTTVQPATRGDGDDTWVYAKGELIAGHKPMWKIWGDDMVNNHLFVHPIGDISTDPHQGYVYRYLLFVDDFQNDTIDLQYMEGWNNARQHEPFLNVSSETASIEIHNHVVAICQSEQMIPDYSTTTVHRDDTSIFIYDNGVDISVSMGLGNAPLWSRERSYVLQQLNHVYGMAAVIRWETGNLERNLGWAKRLTTHKYTSGGHTYYEPFDIEYSRSTAQTAKDNLAIFRDGLTGEGGTTATYRLMLDFPGMSQSDISNFISAVSDDDVEAKVELAALTNAIEYEEEDQPQQWDWMILCRRIVGARPLTLSGSIDPYISTQPPTNYRFILHTPKVGDYWVYPLWTNNLPYGTIPGRHKTRAEASDLSSKSEASHGGVMFYFSLWSGPLTDPSAHIVNISTFDDISVRVRLTGKPGMPTANTWYQKDITERNDDGTTSALVASPYDYDATTMGVSSGLAETIFPDGSTPLDWNYGNPNYDQYVYQMELPNTDRGIMQYTNGKESAPLSYRNISSDTTVELWLGE